MTARDLANVNINTRRMISEYMDRKGLNMSSFSKLAGVHQNQIWLYLKSGDSSKGLHSGTLEKIGRYIVTNP